MRSGNQKVQVFRTRRNVQEILKIFLTRRISAPRLVRSAKYINKYIKSAMSTCKVSRTIPSDFPEMLKSRYRELKLSTIPFGIVCVLLFFLSPTGLSQNSCIQYYGQTDTDSFSVPGVCLRSSLIGLCFFNFAKYHSLFSR